MPAFSQTVALSLLSAAEGGNTTQSPSIEAQVDTADDDSCNREDVRRDIWIYQFIQIVKQEAALVWLDSGPLLQRIFCEGQWTRPIKNFRKNSPDERCDVQPPENRSGPCEESSEYYPKNEKGVENKN